MDLNKLYWEMDLETQGIAARVLGRSGSGGQAKAAKKPSGGPNCGIGPGGFQPGNTCAGDSSGESAGGGGGESEADDDQE